jgi:hypothetical protein
MGLVSEKPKEEKENSEPELTLAAPGLELSAVSVDGMADELQALGEAAFRAKHANGFLILSHAPPAENDWLDLDTSESSIPRYPASAKRRTGLWAMELAKSRRNAYASKITLGRARNNDIIIRSSKISKLHCTFHPDDRGGFDIADVGSLNGTIVNGVALEVKKRRPLQAGDYISIWRYVFEFTDLTGLIAKMLG